MNESDHRDPKTGQFLSGHQFARKHGLSTDTIPERLRRRVRREKANWIADIGPTKKDLTTSERVLIDTAAFMLQRTLTIELWLEDNPQAYAKMLAKGLRDSYLSWANSLRLTLRELGIKTRQGPKGMTEKEFLEDREHPEEG